MGPAGSRERQARELPARRLLALSSRGALTRTGSVRLDRGRGLAEWGSRFVLVWSCGMSEGLVFNWGCAGVGWDSLVHMLSLG